MDHLDVLLMAVCARVERLAARLIGCSHRRTSFPITLRANSGLDGQPAAPAETYVVCLGCGRHLAYDWNTLCIADPRPARAGSGQMHGQGSEWTGLSGDERLLSKSGRPGPQQEARADRGSQ
jgi:hypothetical protein